MVWTYSFEFLLYYLFLLTTLLLRIQTAIMPFTCMFVAQLYWLPFSLLWTLYPDTQAFEKKLAMPCVAIAVTLYLEPKSICGLQQKKLINLTTVRGIQLPNRSLSFTRLSDIWTPREMQNAKMAESRNSCTRVHLRFKFLTYSTVTRCAKTSR